MVERQLLPRNLRPSPLQPATALWRSIELDHLLRAGVLPLEGRGLDLGCGDGAITELIRDRLDARWQLVGIDPDPEELALAEERRLYERLEQAEGSAVEEADASFDFVFSNSVLEHVEALAPTLQEVSRVLKPGGSFVFTVPSEFFPGNLGTPGLVGRFATGARSQLQYRQEIDRRVVHRRYLTVARWRSVLADVDLELVHASYYMSRAETRRWAALSNATAGMLVRLTGRRAAPIDIQRRLGLRRGKASLWLRVVGLAVGELGTLGLERVGMSGSKAGSCLLVVARKRGVDG